MLNKKLLPKGQENFIDYLRWSIEGSGGSTTHVKITAISCEASLGKRDCKVSFSGEFNNGKGEEPEFSFGMRVRLFQGEVMSAQIVDMAG